MSTTATKTSKTDPNLQHTTITKTHTHHSLVGNYAVTFERNEHTTAATKVGLNKHRQAPWYTDVDYTNNAGQATGWTLRIHRDGKISTTIPDRVNAATAEAIGKAWMAASILAVQLKTGDRDWNTGEVTA